MYRMMSDYAVEPINDGISEFNVEFHGPKESVAERIVDMIAQVILEAKLRLFFYFLFFLRT
ncbi:unnamed protein product [Camellia sinensis]